MYGINSGETQLELVRLCYYSKNQSKLYGQTTKLQNIVVSKRVQQPHGHNLSKGHTKWN